MGLVSFILVTVVSLLIGGFGIWMGVRLLLDQDADFGYAVVTAAIGALVWGLLSFVELIPFLGPLLMLIIWIGIVNWRYPGGWLTAAGIGFVAWLVAVAMLWLLAFFDVFTFEALGIPGA